MKTKPPALGIGLKKPNERGNKMNNLHNLLALCLLLLFMALPVMAQDEPLPDETAVLLPAVLSALVAMNLRLTEMFKRMLASPQIGYTPSESVRGVLVLGFSIVLGIVSAWLTPDATSWLPASFQAYPIAAIVVTGFSVSCVGSIVYEVLKRVEKPSPAPHNPAESRD
jgi:apolipoprotein N-acyltransferase